MKFFQLHHFSSSSPNFIFIGFSKFIGAPFLSSLLLRHRSLTSRSLGRSNRTFTWRGREPELPSPLSDKLRWRDSFDLFYIYLDLLFWYRGKPILGFRDLKSLFFTLWPPYNTNILKEATKYIFYRLFSTINIREHFLGFLFESSNNFWINENNSCWMMTEQWHHDYQSGFWPWLNFTFIQGIYNTPHHWIWSVGQLLNPISIFKININLKKY